MLIIKKVEKRKTKQELITPLVVNKSINKTSLKVVTHKKHVVMEKPHAVNNSNKYYSEFITRLTYGAVTRLHKKYLPTQKNPGRPS